MNPGTAASLGVSDGDQVRVTQGTAVALLFARIDPRIPDGCVRVPSGHVLTAGLGRLDGELQVERVGLATRASA
jgi:NADH-quinone oxidoreductase subunit G